MWPSGSNWPQWPQNMPSTVAETNRWAELARQWAAANAPQTQPPQQLPPPPPPPPPPPVEAVKIEDQDDRVLVPLTPFDDNSNASRHHNNYNQMPLRDYPRPPDRWQDDNFGYYQPSGEAYGSYPDVYEQPPRPNFRPVAPPLPPSLPPPHPHGMHNPMACPPPPPFNGEEDWAYNQQCYPPNPQTMPYPPPPSGLLPSLPAPVLFPVGSPDVHPSPWRHRLPPPHLHHHPVPEHVIPAFQEAVNPWLPPQQSAPQPRSALPTWLRDELERLEKQRRKEQERLELAQEVAKDRVRESLDEGDVQSRCGTDDAVLMEAESDASENSDSNEAEEDTGSNLGKVRATNSYSPSHGDSISALKTALELESPPPPVTELEYQVACARLQGSLLTNECHRFIRDALTDVLLEVTTLAINQVCEETLLQARQAAYGMGNDLDNICNIDEVDDRSSASSSLPAGAGVLGLTAYVSDSESETADHPDPKLSEPEELPSSAPAGKPLITQEPKDARENSTSEIPESSSPPRPGSSSVKSRSLGDKKSRKESTVMEETKSHDDKKKRPSSTFSRSKERPSHSNEMVKRLPKSKISKIEHMDTASSVSHYQRRRSRSLRRSRSRDLSIRRRRRSRSRSRRCSRRQSHRRHRYSRSSRSNSTSSSSSSSSRSRERHRRRRRH